MALRVLASALVTVALVVVPSTWPVLAGGMQAAGMPTARPASAVPLIAGSSSDGRISVDVRTSTSTIVTPGTPVTFTYTVTNSSTTPAYQVSLTDTECGPITATSGLRSDGLRWWIPAGQSATYTCATPVDITQTGTTTASFRFVDTSGTSTISTATATSTVTLSSACSTIWYGSTPSASTVDGINTGSIGTVTSAGLTPEFFTYDLAPNTPRSRPMEHIRALGVDPTSGALFYIASPLITNDEAGLFRVNPDGSNNRRVTGPSQATNAERLAVDGDGTVWTWDEFNILWKLPAGATTWTRVGLPPGPWPASGAYADYGDIVFDGSGNLYLLGHDGGGIAYLSIIAAADLATLSTLSPVTTTRVRPSEARFYAGLAFGPDGRLYASMVAVLANQIVDVLDPVTGIGTRYTTARREAVGDLDDLASCAAPKGQLVATKTATTSRPAVEDGDEITYSVQVRNTGGAPVVGASLADVIPANTTYVPGSTTVNGSAVADVSGAMPFATRRTITGTSATGTIRPGVIPAGGTVTVSFKVRVAAGTLADRAVTGISNQATITSSAGTVRSDDPSRPTGTSAAPDPTITPLARTEVAVAKKASVTSVSGSGTVTYAYTVTNTGVDPLARVSLTDAARTDASGTTAPLSTATCASPTRRSGDANGNGLLDPTETWAYTCDQPLEWKPGDKDPTTVSNTATVTAVGDFTTKAVTATGSASVRVVPRPAHIDVVKTAGTVTGPDTTTGESSATYTVTVRNSGQLPTTYGDLVDIPAFAAGLEVLGVSWTGQTTGSGPGSTPVTLAPAGTALAAGATHTYTVTVRFAATSTTAVPTCDAGAGLSNAVTLPDGQEHGPTSDNTACLAPPAPPKTGVTITKSAGSPVDADADGVIDAGDTVAFTFTVGNTGSLTVTNVAVDDALLAQAGIAVTCAADRLAPGASTTCRSSRPYPLTQADVDSGALTNTATATAKPPYLDAVTSAETSVTVPLLRTPVLGLEKRVAAVTDVDKDGVTDPGDTISYRFTVINRGNVT